MNTNVHYMFSVILYKINLRLMFSSCHPVEERFTPEPASLRPPEIGFDIRGKSSGTQKQPRIPVSNSLSREGQLGLGCSKETGEAEKWKAEYAELSLPRTLTGNAATLLFKQSNI